MTGVQTCALPIWQPVEWVLKLLFCGVVAFLLIFLSGSLLNLIPSVLTDHAWAIEPIILTVFVLYDIVFSKMIAYLFKHLHW